MTESQDAQDRALAIRQTANLFLVDSPESIREAEHAILEINQFIKEQEADRNPAIASANATHKLLTRQKDAVVGPAKEAKDALRAKMGAYQAILNQQSSEREAIDRAKALKTAQDAALTQAQALADLGDQKGSQAILDAACHTIPMIPVGIVQAPLTNTSFREDWHFQIDNPDLIPREYCTPDQDRLDLMAKAMQFQTGIPGGHPACRLIPVTRGRG